LQDKPRDPLMRLTDNKARLSQFKVVSGGVIKPAPKPTRPPSKLRRLLWWVGFFILTVSIPWFTGLTLIFSGAWDFLTRGH